MWMRDLGPSPDLFDSFFGKKGTTPIPVDIYLARYVEEMKAQRDKIAELAERVDRGETITLLCSKDCIIAEICHRTALAKLIEAARKR